MYKLNLYKLSMFTIVNSKNQLTNKSFQKTPEIFQKFVKLFSYKNFFVNPLSAKVAV